MYICAYIYTHTYMYIHINIYTHSYVHAFLCLFVFSQKIGCPLSTLPGSLWATSVSSRVRSLGFGIPLPPLAPVAVRQLWARCPSSLPPPPPGAWLSGQPGVGRGVVLESWGGCRGQGRSHAGWALCGAAEGAFHPDRP